MREILFRGKRVEDGEWVCGNSIIILNNSEADKPYDMAIFDEHWQLWQTVDPETVGQYTGLTDKNDKKIFEGDIVQSGGERYKARGYVEWQKAECAFLVNVGDDWDTMDTCEWEVIGDIHDNPALLEDEE